MAFTSTLELSYEPAGIDADTAKGKWVVEEYSYDGSAVTTGDIVLSHIPKTAYITGDLTGSYFVDKTAATLALTFPSGAVGSVRVTILRK